MQGNSLITFLIIAIPPPPNPTAAPYQNEAARGQGPLSSPFCDTWYKACLRRCLVDRCEGKRAVLRATRSCPGSLLDCPLLRDLPVPPGLAWLPYLPLSCASTVQRGQPLPDCRPESLEGGSAPFSSLRGVGTRSQPGSTAC
jgi:hypothetical protein